MITGTFSETRLDRIRGAMRRHVESGYLPGAAWLVSRRGEVHAGAVGTSEPIRRDTIFRIASVTKPIVAAAALILVEERRLRLDDPVDPLARATADRQVLRSIDSQLDDTVPAHRPIALRDLLTFRLGHGALIAPPGANPIQQAQDEAGLTSGPRKLQIPPDELMECCGKLPLLHQPGEHRLYNTVSDILGVRIARNRQQPGRLPAGADLRTARDGRHRLQRARQQARPAAGRACCTNFETGQFEVFDGVEDSAFAGEVVFESGAGGLVSTVDDLRAFGQMMLNGGSYEGRRVLSRASVELMTTDQITFWTAAYQALDE